MLDVDDLDYNFLVDDAKYCTTSSSEGRRKEDVIVAALVLKKLKNNGM